MGKRDEARAETMERILAAARAEIARVGGVGLSMRSVAREVGMVSSAVYRYFPTREHLLTAMILESYSALAAVLRRTAARSCDRPDHERWIELADALRDWGLGAPHEFQLIYGTPIPGYKAPPETIPAAGAVAAPFLECIGMRSVEGFDLTRSTEGIRALADGTGTEATGAAAVVAALSELVGFVGHEQAGHFAGLAEPGSDLYRAVVVRQVRSLGLDQEPRGEDDGEWNLRFAGALSRQLASRPGTETDDPSDGPRYRIDSICVAEGHLTLIWSFPGQEDASGAPVRAGRHWDLAELRAGFSPSRPDVVADAAILNDFYPPYPPSEDRVGPDGIRWLGPPPPQ